MVERDEKGHFVKGWKGGPGRPPKNREDRYYQIAVSAVAFQQWRKIIKKAADKAERGDVAALRFLADYLLGKPTQEIRVDQPGSFLVLAWGDADDSGATAESSSGPEDGQGCEGKT